MEVEARRNPSGSHLWSAEKRSLVERNVESILGAVISLPVRYWKPGMFFTGARDRQLRRLTGGAFPAGRVTGKSRPIFALEALPHASGFRVCPCSSRIPFRARTFRYIREGCSLLHTNYRTDRNSYLVEQISFNIPPGVGHRLRFRGIVPDDCLIHCEKSKTSPATQ